MNDRFKFRVWQTKRELYIYQRNSLIDNLGDLYEMKAGLKPLNPDIHIVEQCTGLKDKNGNLIYEGDIVQLTLSCKQVVWQESKAGWALLRRQSHTDLSFIADSVEVIGNIHEHAHLLEASHENTR